MQTRIDDLEEAVRARDEFICTIGHELKNPLTPLYLQTRLLLDRARASNGRSISADWLLPRLDLLMLRMGRFLDTLNRLLDVSRLSTGQLDLEIEEVDLAKVVHEVAAGQERELAVAQCALRLPEPRPVLGRWDRLRVEQIASNLLSNAIRYGAGQPIEIDIESNQAEARLIVRDHGIGISEEDQRRIFDRYERVTQSQQTRTGGLGIGLWIVRSLCAALGGSVRVTSSPGEGAVFTVTLPRDGARTP